MTAGDIIEKYQVPKEFYEAMFEAYAEGAKRGFIEASIKGLFGTLGNDLKPSDSKRSSGSSKSPKSGSPISRKGQT